MASTPGRLLAAGALLFGVTGLGGCGLLDGSSHLEEALEYLPADATSVQFVDRAAMAERLDIDDIETGASDDELDEWVDAVIEEGYGTELTQYARVMQEAAFSDFDVEWEVAGYADGRVLVWKLDDDVDFDDVADDLVDAGYERSGDDDRPRFTADLSAAGDGGLIGDRYPATMLDVALVPDERLVITGDVDAGLDVATDDADSLSDEGSFADLLDAAPGTDGIEFASLFLEPLCGERRLTPEQQEAQGEQPGRPEEGIAAFADPDERVTVVRLHASDDAAKEEAEMLEDQLDASGRLSGLDVDFDVEQDHAAVLVEADFDDRRKVVAALNNLAGPFGCSGG